MHEYFIICEIDTDTYVIGVYAKSSKEVYRELLKGVTGVIILEVIPNIPEYIQSAVREYNIPLSAFDKALEEIV